MTDRHKCQAALREIGAGSRQIVELAFEQEGAKFIEEEGGEHEALLMRRRRRRRTSPGSVPMRRSQVEEHIFLYFSFR